MAGALDGIRVLDVGLLVQGPQAALLLSDMGADVIKIELPEVGDPARWIFVNQDDERSAYFHACNRGKRSITLDLRTPSGAAIFKRLAATADVIISNFKPGTMDSWGLGYEDLRVDHPGLIWGAGSAFGTHGPDAAREGADLAGQAAGGLISTIGHDGHPPSPVGVTIADHIASQNLAAGVLAALVNRGRTAQGQRVEVSLLGGQIWAQAAEYSHFLMTDEVPGRGHYGHPLLRGLYGIFQTKNGWLGIIGVPPDTRDAFFVALDRPEVALDSRFQGLLASREDMQELFALLNPAFQAKTTEAWSEILNAIGVRYAPVRDYAEVAADPGAWRNGYFQRVRDAQGQEVAVVGTPIAMTETPLEPSAQCPTLGEHTQEVLLATGYSADEISQFRAAGAV
jgi:crotonobetainyl-CoA:carnitine CoA-transferase CaiB-like acyl-CoA transferase